MKRDEYKKKIFSFVSILMTMMVYAGAVLIYLYAHGWRIDPSNQIFIKTGVLTVQSDPFLANLYIEGESKGRTPKSVSLPIGFYNISVYRNGYFEWRKDIEIKEEKSTPVYPWLIKEDIKRQNIFSLQDREYIKSWPSETKDYIYFLVRQPITTNQSYRYYLYRFDINTVFWDLNSNPRIVLMFDSIEDPNIDLNLSPGGIIGILSKTEEGIVKQYLIDSNKSSDINSLVELNISQFSSYEMSWALNSQYLMFESDTDVISFDIQRETRYLLLKKVEGIEYIWSTDEQGFFYLIESSHNNERDDIYAYTLIQEAMNGSNPKVLIEDLYFQKNKDFITKYRDDTGSGKYIPFTISPESTKSVGKIEEIRVNQNAKGIYLKTETSAYWYNIDKKKYHLVSPYSSELVQFAPDNYKFIFKDTRGYSVFTFLKDDGDHTVEIGAKAIKDIDSKTSDVHWISNSAYIWYVKDNSMYIADKDGENVVKILDSVDTLKYYVITFSRDKAYTFYIGDILEGMLSNILIDSYSLR